MGTISIPQNAPPKFLLQYRDVSHLSILRGTSCQPRDEKRMCADSQQGIAAFNIKAPNKRKNQRAAAYCCVLQFFKLSHCESWRLLILQVQSGTIPLMCRQ